LKNIYSKPNLQFSEMNLNDYFKGIFLSFDKSVQDKLSAEFNVKFRNDEKEKKS
jgi:hypothetical protein